jgi:hypothetical protein
MAETDCLYDRLGRSLNEKAMKTRDYLKISGYSAKSILSIFLFLFFPSLAPAGVNTWTNMNFGGGEVLSMAIDPVSKQNIYVGMHGYGVFKSTNGGLGWSAINTGISWFDIGALAVDPSNSNIVYAASRTSYLYKSTNGGGNWQRLNTTFDNIRTIVIDFKNTNRFGSFEIASDQPISVVALRGTTNQRNDFLITTTPIADLTQSPDHASIYFPQIVDGGGYTTQFILISLEGGLDVTIRLHGHSLIVFAE